MRDQLTFLPHERVCSKCGESKPLSEFYVQRECRDGHRPDCIACFLLAVRGNGGRWRERNPEAAADANRRNQRAHPERRRRIEAARRARKLGQFVEDIDALVVLERDDGVCGVCGEDVNPLDFHVDHIVALSHGGLHAYSNVQAAHPFCNLSKGGSNRDRRNQ